MPSTNTWFWLTEVNRSYNKYRCLKLLILSITRFWAFRVPPTEILHNLVSSTDTEGSILAIYGDLRMHSNEPKFTRYIKDTNILSSFCCCFGGFLFGSWGTLLPYTVVLICVKNMYSLIWLNLLAFIWMIQKHDASVSFSYFTSVCCRALKEREKLT